MASADSATYSDIKRAGSGFTFTGNLASMAVNDEWTGGYRALVDGSEPNDLTSMWNAVSSGAEDSGNELYRTIRNYIDDIGNIDTCGLAGLRNYAGILGAKSDYLDVNISFPIEIKNLIEIFSVNEAYLYNKSTDGSKDTLVLPNSILHWSTVERYLSSLKDKDAYAELVSDVFYNTIVGFLNLKTVTFDDSVNGNVPTEIWKTDPSRFLNRLWSDDITSEEEIYSLKESLGVSKSFTEKIYADDIIAGRRRLDDFSDIEQTVLRAEMLSRETRYGDSNAMRYYYMRLYKVVEYFRFATIAYNNAYELEEYDLNATKYSVVSNSDNRLSLLRFNYSEYEIDESAVRRVARWLTNLSFGIRGVREQMKSQCRRNMMVGTKRLIVDLVRRFVLEKIDGGVLRDVRDSILHSAGLNRKFGVSIIEYSDMTEYFNIENPNDAVKPSDAGLNPRYWEMYDDSGNAFDGTETLEFYNRLFGDSKRFARNTSDGADGGSDNLYEFLSLLFESGATDTTNSDYYLTSELYLANGGSGLESEGARTLSDGDKDRVARYAGDMNFADVPYAQHKNRFHPSYQIHPFVQAFEEYNEAYTSVMNLVNSYTESVDESFRLLSERLDAIGNTVNFWLNWNDDFSGYSTTYEKGGSDFDRKSAHDGPFDFGALQDFLSHPGEYVNNILNGVNPYYFDKATGKPLFTTDETRIEVARLQKYQHLIEGLSGREIYRYGKDAGGNIYILYKGEGSRRERNALGDVWVRMRNHPIAFPLFDLSLSPVRFNDTSCIRETDNSKLLSVLTKVVSYFSETYGVHRVDGSVKDGDIDMSGVTLNIGTYSETVPVTTDPEYGGRSYAFSYSGVPYDVGARYRLVEVEDGRLRNFAFGGIHPFMVSYDVSSTEGIQELTSTSYYVDSTDGTVLDQDAAGTYSVSSAKDGVYASVDNQTGRVLFPPEEGDYCARYDRNDSSFVVYPSIREKSAVVFADYDDRVVDDGRTYYCRSSITGKVHPCVKREIALRRLILLEDDALSGTVLEDGSVEFGGGLPAMADGEGERTTPYYRSTVASASPSASAVVDGGHIYQDFGMFGYYYVRGGKVVQAPKDEIVIVAGSNPFHIAYRPDGRPFLERAYRYGDVAESETVVFKDSIYRPTNTAPIHLSAYHTTSCEFLTGGDRRYSDTIGQFYLGGSPYTLYQPFTEVDGVPVEVGTPEASGREDGRITLFGRDGTATAFSYRLVSHMNDNVEWNVETKYVGFTTQTETLAVTSCKLDGRIALTPANSIEYPIYLDFSASEYGNTAAYSSFSSEISQQKFFDMGFSYNQKLFYLSYADGSDEYMDGGTVVGRIDETFDENYSSTLSLHRDSRHNVEYVDADSSFLSKDGGYTFHIGDASSKSGIFSVYGRIKEGSRSVEMSVTLFSAEDVRTKKFDVPVRNGLYEFGSGSRYSFAVSCTDDRLYVSFTTNPPGAGYRISNTVNGYNGGVAGSTRFGAVSSGFMDCMAQIASFDITDDEVEYLEDETRFILGGGEIGFLQQFPGVDGKNNVFSNRKLEYDHRFPVQPQFHELTGEQDIEFLRTYSSTITGSSTDEVVDASVRTFNRYINLTPYTDSSADEISGFLVEDGNEKAFLSVALPGYSESASSVEFSSIGGRPIIDVSRGLDGGGYVGMVDECEKLREFSGIDPEPSVGDRYMVLYKCDGSPKSNSVYEFKGTYDARNAALSSWRDEYGYAESAYFITVGNDGSTSEIHNGSVVRFMDSPIDYRTSTIGGSGYDTHSKTVTASVSYTPIDFSDDVEGDSRYVLVFANPSMLPQSAELTDYGYAITNPEEYEDRTAYRMPGSFALATASASSAAYGYSPSGIYMMAVSESGEHETGDVVELRWLHVDSIESASLTGPMWSYVDSRPNHGVNVISDGLDTSNRCAAFVDGSTAPNARDVLGKKLSLMPIHSGEKGYTRFDFSEIVDADNRIYSLHADGRTVSVMSVLATDGAFNPVSGICEYHITPPRTLRSVKDLPADAEDGDVLGVDGDGPYEYSTALSSWERFVPRYVRNGSVYTIGYSTPMFYTDGYSRSSTSGGRRIEGTCQGSTMTWFGDFGGKKAIQAYAPSKVHGFSPVPFSARGVPMMLEPLYAEPNGTVPTLAYSATKVVSDGDGSYSTAPAPSEHIRFGYGESVEVVADTAYDNLKLIKTSFGKIYIYDVDRGRSEPAHTLDRVNAEIDIDRIQDFESVMSETEHHVMVSYRSESMNVAGVVRTRKNTPDSIAEGVVFRDGNGVETSPGYITKFLSVGQTVLAEEEDGYRIFISKDDGATFRPAYSSADDSLHLVGCGFNRFYARHGNGEKVFSEDGETWENATDIHASEWTVINASGTDYIACENYDPDLAAGILETDKYLMVDRQMTVGRGAPIEKIRVDGSGNIVCISGMDGKTPLTVYRSFLDGSSYGEFERYEYGYVVGPEFSGACAVGDDIVLSPNGGMDAVVVVGAFGRESRPAAEFVDISSALNDEVNIFGGFGFANGRLLMFPSDGSAILVYDPASRSFQRIYSFDGEMTLCDCDSIDFTRPSDAILSPRSSSVNGEIKFSRTLFDDRMDYGIVEVDEGYPILVEYSRLNTRFVPGDEATADMVKITFRFLNDANRRTVSVLSDPTNVVGDGVPGTFDLSPLKTAEAVYIVNGSAIKYRLSSVDGTSKFVIDKLFSDYADEPSDHHGLRFDLLLADGRVRASVDLGYSNGGGTAFAYGDATAENAYRVELDHHDGGYSDTKGAVTELIAGYAFADSITVTGKGYGQIRVTEPLLVKDSNFVLSSDYVSVDDLSEMFDGCSNAVFSSRLVLSESVTGDSYSMFRGCSNARLPSVDMGRSRLENMSSMFEECRSAELAGVEIPGSATNISKMFRNAKRAHFNEISDIPVGVKYCDEAFSGCESGSFANLRFGESIDAENFGNMFYWCRSMDCGDLGLERISENIKTADSMFANAGRPGTTMLDGRIFRFSSIDDCRGMFLGSNFAFSDSFFVFGRWTTATETGRMFAGCGYCSDRSPAIVLSDETGGAELSADTIDSALDGPIRGDASKVLRNFSRLYEGSSFRTLDLRGISNCTTLTENRYGSVQDFTSMCIGCRRLEGILGFVPPHGKSYASMFEDCTSLSADISKLFREDSTGWTSLSDLGTAFRGGEAILGYRGADMAGMFRNCACIFSSSDIADIVGIFRAVDESFPQGDGPSKVENMFPPMRVAAKGQVPGIRGVDYDMHGISERTGTVRFNSFADEGFEAGGDASPYGMYSEYARSAFPRGFYRYGGRFRGDASGTMFFILYYPERDEYTGSVVGFSRRSPASKTGLSPHGWPLDFQTDPSRVGWNGFTIGTPYAAMVCDSEGNFLRYAYVGNYVRNYHETRIGSGGAVDVVTNYEMPATYFDGLEGMIEPL